MKVYIFLISGVNTAGLAAGLTLGSLFLVSSLFVGVLLCVVVAVVVHHKKKISRVRTRNVAENLPDYRMSDLAAIQDATIPPGAAGYTPNPYTPYPQQQQQQQPQYQNPGKGVSAMDQDPPAYGEETKDNFDTNFEHMYDSVDYEDLTN